MTRRHETKEVMRVEHEFWLVCDRCKRSVRTDDNPHYWRVCSSQDDEDRDLCPDCWSRAVSQ